jgi:hypothetical protein
MLNWIRRITLLLMVVLAIFASAFISGCERDSDFENAAEDAAESTGDSLEEAGDDMEEATDQY